MIKIKILILKEIDCTIPPKKILNLISNKFEKKKSTIRLIKVLLN